MNGLNALKGWIGALTEVALMLLGLGIVLALLAGPQVPFLGNVVGNIVTLINDLGKNGVTGLIALGVILWLFSKRTMQLIPDEPGTTHCRPRVARPALLGGEALPTQSSRTTGGWSNGPRAPGPNIRSK